jgi:uncharacterized metal-binding protein
MAEEGCYCSATTNVVLACSGGSNVGQLTNEAAKRLNGEKVAKFSCLAGIGGQVGGMVASVKGADKVLVIDGCPVACAKHCMTQAGIEDYQYLVVTDLGIEKNSELELAEPDVNRVLAECRLRLNGSQVNESGIE